jgi:hypothetical protein
MRNILPVIIICFCVFALASCKKKEKSPHIMKPVFSTYLPSKTSDTALIKEIYYGLLTPVEVCHIFDRLGLTFNDTIISPFENCDLYMSSYKAAMNLGVYGVDMGYMKLFGVNKQTVNYFNAIKKLSGRLNMPDSFLIDAISGIERNMNNADSLTSIMTETYSRIENHLREEGSQGTLGLMMMGGWIEAMFLSTQLAFDPANPDPQVVEKIAEQKYSLMSLLSFMKNYYDDPMVVFYTKKLKYLDKWFNSYEIYFHEGDVKIDTTRQVITSSGSEMTVTVETLTQIRDYISRLRTEITSI